MTSHLPALVFGTLLALGGGLMLYFQRRAAAGLSRENLPPQEARFLASRIRRRSQVAGLILLVGVMIPVGDSVIPWSPETAGTWAVYFSIVLALAGWIGLLGLSDLLATRNYARTEFHHLQRQQLAFREMATRLQEARDQNSSEQ